METWLPILLALVATVPGILAYLNQRSKVPAETTDIYTGAAKKLLDALSNRLDTVTTRMERLEEEAEENRVTLETAKTDLIAARGELEAVKQANNRLRSAASLMLDGIRKLTTQLTASNIAPAWHPSEALINDLNGISTQRPRG